MNVGAFAEGQRAERKICYLAGNYPSAKEVLYLVGIIITHSPHCEICVKLERV
ncbi:hypothetical protein [Eisenbergiella tayi]|uniref:hypothetical protein n=1 Tax=Eisenbergiella tayi TaxID=1432052 RepID=UPI00135AD2B3|nr:hypothetical protein [Eisenbergiella tayi]